MRAAVEARPGTVEYGVSGVVPGDCNGDGVVDASDLACVSTIEERDIVLASIPTLAGDLDGNGDVAFPDFLVLSANFGQDLPSYTDGNIDLVGGVAFPDFLVLSANFGQTAAAAAAVPEPSGLLGLACGALLLCTRRRRRRRTLVSRRTKAMATKPLMTAFLIVVGMVALPLSNLQSAEYAQTFDFPDGTDDLGDGSIIFASTRAWWSRGLAAGCDWPTRWLQT